jgi:hypothetical protein
MDRNFSLGVGGLLFLLVALLLFSVLGGVSPLAAHGAATHTAHILSVSWARQQDEGQDCYEDSHFLVPSAPSVPVSKLGCDE